MPVAAYSIGDKACFRKGSLFAASQKWAGKVVTIIRESSPPGYGRQTVDIEFEDGDVYRGADANDLERYEGHDHDTVVYQGPSRSNPQGINTRAGAFGREAAKEIIDLARSEGITITAASYRYREAAKLFT